MLNMIQFGINQIKEERKSFIYCYAHKILAVF